VLLIHGAPQTGHAWRKVMPTLAQAGYQVVVPTTVALVLPPSPVIACKERSAELTCDVELLFVNIIAAQKPIQVGSSDATASSRPLVLSTSSYLGPPATLAP